LQNKSYTFSALAIYVHPFANQVKDLPAGPLHLCINPSRSGQGTTAKMGFGFAPPEIF